MFDPQILAGNIKNYRKISGMTQQNLAKELMVSAQSISKWETGIAMPDLENLCLLAHTLHVSVERLLGTFAYEQCMIGVDGGGTKTEFVLFTSEGKVLKRIQKAGCNPNICGCDEAISVLRSGIDSLIRENSMVCGIYVGAAGFSTGDHKSQITKSLKRLYPQMKIGCDTDILNVIASATDEENCIAAICGTGTVVYASENGNLHRVGGWGYLLDKGGSGFDIGRDGLAVALAQRDGIGEKSLITELIERKLGGETWDYISDIYRGGNSYIASFAPIVSEACEAGDAQAGEILERNATRLASLINYAAQNLASGKTLVMAGSVITKDGFYRNLVRSKLNSELKLIIPQLPPVYGACIQCCGLCGIETDGIKENFVQTYNTKDV